MGAEVVRIANVVLPEPALPEATLAAPDMAVAERSPAAGRARTGS